MYHQNIWKRFMALAVSIAMLVATPIVSAAQTTDQSTKREQQEILEQTIAENNRVVSGDNAEAADGFVIENGLLKEYRGKDKEIVIPEDVTIIGVKAFAGNKWLKKVIIPGSVKKIHYNAFMDCKNLKSITISKGVRVIKDCAFKGCESLKSITIPKSVRRMGYYAFSDCINLKSATFSEGVTRVGHYTFSDCINLKSVTIPRSVKEFGFGVFDNCSSRLTIYGKKGSHAQEYAKENKIAFSVMKKSQSLKVTREYNKTYGNASFRLNAKLKTGNGKLTYTSSDAKVVTVNNSGRVAIKGMGIATIIVKAGKTAKYDAASVKVTVRVSPKQPKTLTVRAQSEEKIKVDWVLDKNATGYEIQYSTDGEFENENATNTITVKRNRTTSTTIEQGLEKGEEYYIRIRSYRNAKTGKKTQKLYSAWSKTKTVVCK